ncbi:MAG: metallophosphoesterase [Clostridia bacterium]|nr:metallophosphoesterase [Clostridia bacterium]
MKGKRRTLAAAAAVVILLSAWIAHGNGNIRLTTYEVKTRDLPEAFDGLRIVQLSDLHNAVFRDGNAGLISRIEQAGPDMIFITGDMLDSRKTDIQAALSVAEQAAAIAPVYYVTGNHEARIGEYRAFEQSLEKLGVTILRNRTVQLEKDGETINIAGVDDPSFMAAYLDADAGEGVMKWALEQLDTDGCTLLLSHRPELFGAYAAQDIALAFSGHTHGGQIRLPLLGGLYGPHQGFFPEYDGGLYRRGSSAMIVSRGIGNSLFPFRVNNDPEVVLAVLRCE